MSYIDIHAALADWPYDPEKISVRKILGTEGSVRIQMRVELGIAQMEADGRPDGACPFGADTLLDHHRRRLARHQELNGTVLGFSLAPQECYALRLEASLFYRRYVAYFVLEEYDKVVRDTAHSLEIFDFCREYAMETDDRVALEEFRSYVLMMHARGLAYQSLKDGEAASAVAHVNRGIMMIRAHLEERGQAEAGSKSEEIRLLRNLGKELTFKVPKDSLLLTRKALRDAIKEERFEEAARLRDELRNHSHDEP